MLKLLLKNFFSIGLFFCLTLSLFVLPLTVNAQRATTPGAACTTSANCMAGEVCDISKKLCYPLATPQACDFQNEQNLGCPSDQICNVNTGYCIVRSVPPTNSNLPPGPSIDPYSGGTPTVPPYIGGNTGTPAPNASWCGNDPNLQYDSAAKMCLPKTDPCTPGSIACSGSLSELIIKVINYLLIFAGMIAVLAIVIGGFWYITAAGNEEQSEKGKKALINAIIGIVIVSLAFVIVRVISHTLTSGSV